MSAYLSPVADVTSAFFGVPRDTSLDLGLLKGGRGDEEEDQQ